MWKHLLANIPSVSVPGLAEILLRFQGSVLTSCIEYVALRCVENNAKIRISFRDRDTAGRNLPWGAAAWFPLKFLISRWFHSLIQSIYAMRLQLFFCLDVHIWMHEWHTGTYHALAFCTWTHHGRATTSLLSASIRQNCMACHQQNRPCHQSPCHHTE